MSTYMRFNTDESNTAHRFTWEIVSVGGWGWVTGALLIRERDGTLFLLRGV